MMMLMVMLLSSLSIVIGKRFPCSRLSPNLFSSGDKAKALLCFFPLFIFSVFFVGAGSEFRQDDQSSRNATGSTTRNHAMIP